MKLVKRFCMRRRCPNRLFRRMAFDAGIIPQHLGRVGRFSLANRFDSGTGIGTERRRVGGGQASQNDGGRNPENGGDFSDQAGSFDDGYAFCRSFHCNTPSRANRPILAKKNEQVSALLTAARPK